MREKVIVSKIDQYNENLILGCLDNSIFEIVNPADTVVLKPNWVKESHLYKANDWDYVITHPAVITAVLKKVIEKLNRNGRIVITDGPQTDSSFKKIIARYPIEKWKELAAEKNIPLEIIDLRDDEWINEGDVNIKRTKLPGDPRGKVKVNLKNGLSEFLTHTKSSRGYYGADYNIAETNKAHNGKNNLYSVSRSVIQADVFINLPKLKTHKKAGITACLKNLVGINTYKNYLPHHSEGGPSQNGDQFPKDNAKTRIEGPVMAFIKQYLIQNVYLARVFKPMKKIGKSIFGDTNLTIRSGNWYGNDTIWRMILDLNKVLFYANEDGIMRTDDWINTKKYIGIVDGIKGGEGNGPMAPDPVLMGFLFQGTNPVAIDCVCARLMGFDYDRIPSIKNAFNISKYPICDFDYANIKVEIDNEVMGITDSELVKFVVPFRAHFGWINHIEKSINVLRNGENT